MAAPSNTLGSPWPPIEMGPWVEPGVVLEGGGSRKGTRYGNITFCLKCVLYEFIEICMYIEERGRISLGGHGLPNV
jgi:hypothetical protein